MRTWKINIQPTKDAVLCDYFAENTTAAKCMYNVANFYIRNTMTGIRKSPEERTACETEVLHYVFTGIQKANLHARENYEKKLKKYQDMHTEKGDKLAADLKCKVFPYPTKEKWFLSYGVLDAIFKYTDHPTYRRMNSQVNQNAIKKTVKSWKSYFQLQKDYAIHPEKYKARPRIPGYVKNLAMTAAYTNQTARFICKDGRAYLQFVNHRQPVLIGRESLYSDMTYVKTEVKPQYGGYSILLTFKEDIILPEVPKFPKRILGIDVGVDNFCAVANNFGDAPFLIKGGAVKSMNQNFNKERARLLKSRKAVTALILRKRPNGSIHSAGNGRHACGIFSTKQRGILSGTQNSSRQKLSLPDIMKTRSRISALEDRITRTLSPFRSAGFWISFGIPLQKQGYRLCSEKRVIHQEQVCWT